MPPFFRKRHIITSSAGAGTGYQIRVVVHKGDGSDSGEDVYLGSHVRDDFGDVRFVASDGKTLLDYWMESKVDGSYAIFWVEIQADLSTENQTIYIHYGKSDATTTSNGPNTFPWLFDDLSAYNIGDVPNVTDWEAFGVSGNNTVTIEADPADANKRCIRIRNADQAAYIGARALLKAARSGFAGEFRHRDNTAGIHYIEHFETGNVKITSSNQPTGYLWYDGSAYQSFSPSLPTLLADSWHVMSVRVMDSSKTYFHLIVDGIDYAGGWRATPTSGIDKVAFQAYRFNIIDYFIGGVGTNNNYIYFRKFTTPEPVHSTWGSEERAHFPM